MNDNAVPDASPRAAILTFVIFTAALVLGAALLLTGRPEPVQIVVNPPLPTATPAPSATPAPITVYVTGAVTQPETLLTLPFGSRVSDALAAAGGARADADLERVNLAARLRDGDQVHVPVIGQEAALPTANAPAVVNLNTAALDELTTLPGVGLALAQAILDYRAANGPFSSLDDLDQVAGIGPALLNRLQDRVSFD